MKTTSWLVRLLRLPTITSQENELTSELRSAHETVRKMRAANQRIHDDWAAEDTGHHKAGQQ